MKKELLDRPVLCIYDIRAIQKYIFGNALNVDVVGGNRIVGRILKEALNAVFQDESLGLEECEYYLDEETCPDEIPFLTEENVKAQIITIAGGNAFMLYRTGELCQKVSRLFSKYLLENTYSLQVAICAVEMTDNICDDFNNLYLELDKVKNYDRMARPAGALPIVKKEEMTANAISAIDERTGEEISRETLLKRKNIRETDENIEGTDLCDNLKKFNKRLAYLHIDGNSMGITIARIMKKHPEYADGARARRILNKNFQKNYVDVLIESEDWIFDIMKSDGIPPDKYHNFYQRIHIGGDDINIAIACEYAFRFVEHFTQLVSKRYVWQDDEVGTILFSVCTGIGIVSSDTSYKRGLRLAEECCELAKIEAKKPENLINGEVGNWFDYQINYDGVFESVSNVRENNYVSLGNADLCLRPYCLDDCRQGTPTHFSKLKNYYNFLKYRIKSEKVIYDMIAAYSAGEQDIRRCLNTYVMLGGHLPPELGEPFVNVEGRDQLCAAWYDALELVILGI